MFVDRCTKKNNNEVHVNNEKPRTIDLEKI